MITPAWLLLFWSGLAAAGCAAVIGRVVGGTPAAWGLAPLPHSRLHAAAWSLLAGSLLYPLLYGILFELLHRADFRIGAAAGALHGIIMFLIVRRTASTHAALRAAATHLAYGVALALFYVTP